MKEKKRINLKRFWIAIFFLFLIWIRFEWFENHFTCYDDIKVAQFTDFTTNLFDWEFRSFVQKGNVATKIYNIASVLFGKIYNWVSYAINFSKYWTYAPGQFVLTFALLPFAYDYKSIKFFGRLPSLIFGCLSLIMCWKVSKRYTKSDKTAFLATGIVGLSWQSILYCMHMSNYEVIILIGFVGAYLLYVALEKGFEKYWYIGTILMGIMTWFHYQTICYFGGFILTYIVYKFFQNMDIKHIVISVGGKCIVCGAIVFPLVLFANLNGVPTWNKGENGQYLFELSWNLIYIVKFFVLNSMRTFKAMLSPAPLSTPWALLITGAYFIIFVYGGIGGLKEYKLKTVKFYLTVFCLGGLLTQYFFVLIGKFTLSPTRHSNVMIPLFTLQIMIGVHCLLNDSKPKKIFGKCLYLLGILVICVWIAHASQVKQERADFYTSDSVMSLVDEYKPDIVVDYTAAQLWYILGNQCARKEILDYQTDVYDFDFDSSNNNRILIMSGTTKIDHEVVREIADKLVEMQYISEERGTSLLQETAVAKYDYQTFLDFDFYNVTNGSSNSFCYAVYDLGAYK